MKNVQQNKVSVITVSYNSEATIENTILSVINQNYQNVEYLIIDGNSSDGTQEIIKKYEKNISFWLSEKDYGIYDAMNKGLEKATGEWVIFMNSNDRFFNSEVISHFMSLNTAADVLYGYCIDPDNMKTILPKPLELFWKRIPMNHQSTFVRTKLHQRHPFSLKYPISSVYDAYYSMYNKDVKFTYHEAPVAWYDMTGISFFSYKWLIDYIRISWKHTKGMKFRITLRFIYMTLVISYKNLFLKK